MGLQFSSSPLTSLNSAYSANQNPNFNISLQLALNFLFPNNFQTIIDNYKRNFESLEFNLGLDLSQSSISNVKLLGLQMIKKNLPSNQNISGKKPSINGGINMGKIASIGGQVVDLASNFLPLKTEYSGTYGGVTNTMDSIYDGISNAAMSFGPIGTLVGGIMKGGKLLGGVMNSVGGGTDGMTTTDAILGSSFFNLTPVGLINGFGGKRTDTITIDEDIRSKANASYLGAYDTIDEAFSKSGKKYGLLSNSARKKANRLIDTGKDYQTTITDIINDADDRYAIKDYMTSINANKRLYELLGGYLQSAIHVAKHGLSFKNILKAKEIVSKYKEGGKVTDPFKVYLQSLPEYQRDSTNFRVRDYWKFNGRPKNFDEAVSKGMFTLFEDGWHANSVAENPQTGEIEFMKSSSHPSILKEIDWYNSDEAAEFRNLYELLKTEPYWKYVKKSFKEGGKVNAISELNVITELYFPEDIESFKEGGKVNVIPEGALHARLHHMENAENLTKKGIPVVSEGEDGKLELQCEIERGEIIFRLEVVEKLEELMKQYKENLKDEIAIEAGKLLTEEIINNTIDNTNNLL